MRLLYVVAAVGLALAVLFIGPAVMTGASAHADYSGYRSCVGKMTEPVAGRDPQNLQLVGTIEQDLDSGVPPAAEAQKVAQMGFDPSFANGIVRCVIEERP
ncbi:hypothetical protein [Mycobacterium sp. M23085]|uniref:hypothetical protein n=1 Tax=Mycobacterium sp. M23085 TaxID=3378087 RepID=UPI003877C132